MGARGVLERAGNGRGDRSVRAALGLGWARAGLPRAAAVGPDHPAARHLARCEQRDGRGVAVPRRATATAGAARGLRHELGPAVADDRPRCLRPDLRPRPEEPGAGRSHGRAGAKELVGAGAQRPAAHARLPHARASRLDLQHPAGRRDLHDAARAALATRRDRRSEAHGAHQRRQGGSGLRGVGRKPRRLHPARPTGLALADERRVPPGRPSARCITAPGTDRRRLLGTGRAPQLGGISGVAVRRGGARGCTKPGGGAARLGAIGRNLARHCSCV